MSGDLADIKKLDMLARPVIATRPKLDAERVHKDLTDLIQQVEGIKNKLRSLRDNR